MNKAIPTIALVLSLFSIAGFGWLYLSAQQKVGFVRSQELIQAYQGTKEAREILESKNIQWQADLDTLQTEFNAIYYQFVNGPSANSDTLRLLLQQKRRDITRYEVEVAELFRKEEEELMSGVLNQVNSYVQDYGKQNNYRMIFGTTNDGSLLYGTNDNDLTEEVLLGLNKTYVSQ